MTSIHQFLSDDHRRLDALLARTDADPTRIDEASYDEFRRGLLRHIAMEEKVLFAYIRARGDADGRALVDTLHADHAAIASILVLPPSRAMIATLRTVLGEHNPLEEDPGGLYDQCDAAPPAEVAAFSTRMQAIPPVRASEYLDEPRIHAHVQRMLAARRR